MERHDPPSPLEIRLFGTFDVHVHGAPLPALRTRKGQWLLALLVLKRVTPIDRAWLAGTLWPDTFEEHAYTSLRKSLNDLRQALGIEAKRLHAPTPRTLALDLTDVFCDVVVFDAAVAKTPTTSLEQAVALYRGPLLANCSEEWVVLERAEREQNYLHALETLAVQALERHDPSSAIERLRLCIALDPLRESSQRRLMQALATEGNHAAVTRTYRDLRLYLRRELNADPDPETSLLYEQLRMEAQSLARRVAPIRESRTPNEAGVTSSIPQPVTELVGRKEEIEELERCLMRARLVTVTGTGGVGKTRLATEVAQRCVSRYTDGAWFVELAALTEPTLVAQTVASLLEVREQPGVSAEETLLQYLRNREMLLVLDNCEHLIQACMRLAGDLLRHCPGLHLLVTSRQALGIIGETVWRVPSLSFPDPKALAVEKDLPSLLMEFDAVHLFVKRAVLVQPAFHLKPQNAPAVAQICQRLDGIPLAIELAAARLRVLTPEQIAERLEDLFHLLTGGSQNALPRQQTLRSALDWSYALLTEQERALLCSLSVFVGGWTLESVSALRSVADSMKTWEALDLLTSLVDKSLVMFKPGEEGEGRYYLLETVRRYGLDRLLETGEAEAIRTRHLEYFLAMAESFPQRLQGKDQAACLDRIESEHENLRAALQFCVEERCREEAEDRRQEAIEAHLRLVCALSEFWEKRCYWSEGRMHLTEALKQAERASPGLRARALICLGSLSRRQGDHAHAKSLCEQGLTLARELHDLGQVSVALENLGILAINAGDYATGQSCFEESLALSRAREDRRGVGVSLINLATISQPEGDYPKSYRLLQEGLEIFRELEDKASIGAILNNLGNLVYWEGDYTAARAFYEESLEIRRELGNKSGIASVLMHLGNVFNEQGEYERARRLMEESLAIRRSTGEIQLIAYTLHNLGLVAFRQHDYTSAVALHWESVPLLQQVMDRPALVHVLEAFASLADAEENFRCAVRLLAVAATLREQLGTPQPPSMREAHDRQLNTLRQCLGEEAFETEWRQGAELTLEQALEFARREC